MMISIPIKKRKRLMKLITVTENDAGQRLDKFLHKCLPAAPSGFLYKMLRKKNITLNNKRAEGKEILTLFDEVKFFFSDETYEKFSGASERTLAFSDYKKAYRQLTGIQIIYEDPDILILNKPAGVLSQKAEVSDLSLNEWVIGHMLSKAAYSEAQLARFKPAVCNRLDRNTTGLILAGKTLSGLQFLSALLKSRKVHKYYRLFVKGQITNKNLIEGYLVKDHAANKVSILKETKNEKAGKAAYIRTAYRPVRIMEDKTLLEVELITGKTHQIRAHLSSIGHPLIGDYKYGDKKLNEYYRKTFGINTQLLHAYRLVFPPLSDEYARLSGKEFIAPLPEIFEKLCKQD